jgi:hypothetical protein
MPLGKRLRLNNQEGLPPCPQGPCQKHQQESICFRVVWSFDLAPKDKELLPEEGIFGNQFRFPSRKVHDRPEYNWDVRGFCPSEEASLEAVKAGGDQWFDVSKNMDTEQLLLCQGGGFPQYKITVVNSDYMLISSFFASRGVSIDLKRLAFRTDVPCSWYTVNPLSMPDISTLNVRNQFSTQSPLPCSFLQRPGDLCVVR